MYRKLLINRLSERHISYDKGQALPRGGRPPRGPGGEAPKDFTKPRQMLQNSNRLYKAPTDYRKLQNIRRNLKRLDKHPKYLTRVANNNIPCIKY